MTELNERARAWAEGCHDISATGMIDKLIAENERLTEERNSFQRVGIAAQAALEAARAEVERLEGAGASVGRAMLLVQEKSYDDGYKAASQRVTELEAEVEAARAEVEQAERNLKTIHTVHTNTIARRTARAEVLTAERDAMANALEAYKQALVEVKAIRRGTAAYRQGCLDTITDIEAHIAGKEQGDG